MIEQNVLIKYVEDIDFDLQKDIDKINELVNKGDFKGILNAIYYYHNAEHVDEFELFIHYCEMLIDKGFNEVLFDIGYAYLGGYDVEDLVVDDLDEMPLNYYTQALSKGFNEAYLYMGDLYRYSSDRESREKCLNFYLKAFECGVKEAPKHLVEYFITEENFDEAIKYALLVKEQGEWYADNLIEECYKIKK